MLTFGSHKRAKFAFLTASSLPQSDGWQDRTTEYVYNATLCNFSLIHVEYSVSAKVLVYAQLANKKPGTLKLYNT